MREAISSESHSEQSTIKRRARAGHRLLTPPQLASRQRKVMALKARIATGRYRVNNRNLARALLKAW